MTTPKRPDRPERPPEHPGDHPFPARPHRTLLALSIPVLFSMIAEPLTGLADTAFVARLGSGPLAALGVGTMILSSIFWIFNFLMIGCQTEVARQTGAGHSGRASQITTLALVLSIGFGVVLAGLGFLLADVAARAMAAHESFIEQATTYLRIRLLSAPAILITMTAFGALRGQQDMRTPLWIAITVNALNVVLDALLIFGFGPVPALGIAGAAWATVASQWLGAVWALLSLRSRIGFTRDLHPRDALKLLIVGRDLFLRTSLLTAFLLLTTRAATALGAEAGAAHQAIRQVWMFTALVLDAFAATAQSLVGYFVGAARIVDARRVAFLTCLWGFWLGVGLTGSMLAGSPWVASLLVPEEAHGVFFGAWIASSLAQPLNAISFVTDGVHWGTSDYRYLRNAMALSTGLGAVALLSIGGSTPGALTWVWVVTGGWITIRAVLGVIRIWPGGVRSPLAPPRDAS